MWYVNDYTTQSAKGFCFFLLSLESLTENDKHIALLRLLLESECLPSETLDFWMCETTRITSREGPSSLRTTPQPANGDLGFRRFALFWKSDYYCFCALFTVVLLLCVWPYVQAQVCSCLENLNSYTLLYAI